MADEDRRAGDISAVSALDLSEIKTLTLIKKVAVDDVQRMLDSEDVEIKEDFAVSAIRNLLHHLRSL